MSSVALAERARATSRSGLDLDGLRLAFDDLLRPVLGYVVGAWSTVDPATGLFTSCLMSGIDPDPAHEARFFAYEFRPDEPSTYASLFASGTGASILSRETGGDLQRAARYREFLAAFGVTDELRATFVDDGVWWGNGTFYRVEGTFGDRDLEALEAVGPAVADGLRLALLRDAAGHPQVCADPPGTVTVAPDGTIAPLTESAPRWLQAGGDRLRAAIVATATAVRSNRDWPGASARVRLASTGRWLAVHASRFAQDQDRVAVIVADARPAEVSDVLVRAYRLTDRQRDVLGLLLQGLSVTQVAGRLDISEHTAHDHRKAIYAKVGVNSRSELAALLQADRYDPYKSAGAPPSPYGWFLTPA